MLKFYRLYNRSRTEQPPTDAVRSAFEGCLPMLNPGHPVKMWCPDKPSGIGAVRFGYATTNPAWEAEYTPGAA